jgi:hypothetical protein
MIDQETEREERKKGIFDAMSKRGQERILRMGYENWDPFQEPKDPRERIFSSASVKAGGLVDEYYRSRQAGQEESVALHKELFDLCRGLLQGETRARAIFEFCHWYREKTGREEGA